MRGIGSGLTDGGASSRKGINRAGSLPTRWRRSSPESSRADVNNTTEQRNVWSIKLPHGLSIWAEHPDGKGPPSRASFLLVNRHRAVPVGDVDQPLIHRQTIGQNHLIVRTAQHKPSEDAPYWVHLKQHHPGLPDDREIHVSAVVQRRGGNTLPPATSLLAGFRYYALDLFGIGACPRSWRRASIFVVSAEGIEPSTY